MEEKKFSGRIYLSVPTKQVRAGDIIEWTNTGRHTSIVDSVTAANVMVKQPKGFKPKTKRVPRKNVTKCWRRRTSIEDGPPPWDVDNDLRERALEEKLDGIREGDFDE